MKRTQMKKGESTSGEDLVSICYKCNFDLNFVQDISNKIDFKLDEYLF